MKVNITWDDRQFIKMLNNLEARLANFEKRTLMEMGNALLTISRLEVPHDTGRLQGSGHVFWDESDRSANTAYNTEYASFVHEGMRRDGTHVIVNFQKGRKKKYLEDPLKMNQAKWLEIAQRELAQFLS